MNIKEDVVAVLDEVLGLKGRPLDGSSPLLGAVPELDSMAVVAVINLLEERFDFAVDDDEIDASTFASVDSLVRFVAGKRGIEA